MCFVPCEQSAWKCGCTLKGVLKGHSNIVPEASCTSELAIAQLQGNKCAIYILIQWMFASQVEPAFDCP